jgi:hypothetical protein
MVFRLFYTIQSFKIQIKTYDYEKFNFTKKLEALSLTHCIFKTIKES